MKFQSTPSAWRETLVIIPFNARFTFQSTPSAWRETRTETALHPSSAYFNPLPPHGGRRPSSAVSSADHSVFQSTPSAWRETDHPRGSHGCCAYFNPLPPHGGRRRCYRYPWKLGGISIHSLRMEGDWWIVCVGDRISIHSLRMEGDAAGQAGTAGRGDFNPLPPHGGRLYHLHPLYANSLFQSTPSAWRETNS